MALHPAIPQEQCGRKSLGGQLCAAENAGLRCGIQSRANGHINKLGGVRWLHLLVAASSLEGAITLQIPIGVQSEYRVVHNYSSRSPHLGYSPRMSPTTKKVLQAFFCFVLGHLTYALMHH